jgi:hypothetical protein
VVVASFNSIFGTVRSTSVPVFIGGASNMKFPKLKKWHWVVIVLVAMSIIANLLPEQQPAEGAETTSPVVLLWIPVIALSIYLVLRSRKKKKAAIKAAEPSVENFQKEINELQEVMSFP